MGEYLHQSVVAVDEHVLEGVAIGSNDALILVSVEDDVLVPVVVEICEEVGLYDEAERLASQRSEAELDRLAVSVPDLPPADQIRAVASELLADLPRLLESGTIEERREFLSHFVKEIEADPAGKSVRISLYRSLFISIIAGAGFEPTTSGL